MRSPTSRASRTRPNGLRQTDLHLLSEPPVAIEQLARERMKTGAASMSAGLEKLAKSTADEDFSAMQQAAAQMRQGLAEFEAGLAARQVLAEGKAARNLALGWFKREMNLASQIQPETRRTVLGVTLLEAVDGALDPATFVATTVKV